MSVREVLTGFRDPDLNFRLRRGGGALAGMRLRITVAVIAGLAIPTFAGAVTDIPRVDQFIDAPRVLFGDSLPAVLRSLGPPAVEDSRMRGTLRDPAVTRKVQRLTYPGMRLEIRDRLVAAEITTPGRGLPWGLDVGASRAAIEAILGDAQEAADDRLLYLYSDGFPKTVIFHLRDGRVRKIEWEYWVD